MRKTITHTAIGLFFAVLIGLLAWPVVSNFITRKNIKERYHIKIWCL